MIAFSRFQRTRKTEKTLLNYLYILDSDDSVRGIGVLWFFSNFSSPFLHY